MAQHSENEYIIPTLMVLYEHIEGCPTETVKEEIGNYITFYEDDLKPYPSRNPNEPRYYQIVGNLISHNNEELFQYIDRVVSEEEIGKKKPMYIMLLNDLGKAYVESLLSKISLNIHIDKNLETSKERPIIDKYDKKIIELASRKNYSNKPIRNQKLAKQVIEICNYKCQYAVLTHQKHLMFNAADGKPYAEAHHLIPLKASSDFFPRNLDRASNLVCLCPSCHAILHHGSKEEKKQILRIIYDHYIGVLNEDEGIFISFNRLLEKYY